MISEQETWDMAAEFSQELAKTPDGVEAGRIVFRYLLRAYHRGRIDGMALASEVLQMRDAGATREQIFEKALKG